MNSVLHQRRLYSVGRAASHIPLISGSNALHHGADVSFPSVRVAAQPRCCHHTSHPAELCPGVQWESSGSPVGMLNYGSRMRGVWEKSPHPVS